MDTETVINLNDENTLFSSDKGLIGKLSRLGVKVHKDNDYGVWFDLKDVEVVVRVKKLRGSGYKEVIL